MTDKFETHEPGRGGWTQWITPVMRGYLMRCCDCGLIHEIQFKIIQQTSREAKDGTWTAKKPRANGLRVAFKARRHAGENLAEQEGK